jgi:hypothetical protein
MSKEGRQGGEVDTPRPVPSAVSLDLDRWYAQLEADEKEDIAELYEHARAGTIDELLEEWQIPKLPPSTKSDDLAYSSGQARPLVGPTTTCLALTAELAGHDGMRAHLRRAGDVASQVGIQASETEIGGLSAWTISSRDLPALVQALERAEQP